MSIRALARRVYTVIDATSAISSAHAQKCATYTAVKLA